MILLPLLLYFFGVAWVDLKFEVDLKEGTVFFLEDDGAALLVASTEFAKLRFWLWSLQRRIFGLLALTHSVQANVYMSDVSSIKRDCILDYLYSQS